MKKLITPAVLSFALLLAACGVDTTGLSPDSSRKPMGPETALVTVTEFGDLQCPACKGAHELITTPMLKKYEGKIRFAFMHFPLMTIHEHALEASEAVECAGDQGKFWEFYNLDYAKQEDLSSTALRDWAAELKLDVPLFDRCVASGIKKATVLADEAAGEKLGVNSTPTYFVNGVRVDTNSIEAVSAAIDAALKNAKDVPL